MRFLRPLLLALLTTTALGSAAAPQAQAFTLGFTDAYMDYPYATPGPDQNLGLLGAGHRNARSADGKIWRIMLNWGSVTRPAKAAPSPASLSADPAWAGYDWRPIDAVIRSATATGLMPFPTITGAPAWAEGPGRPEVSRFASPGTWKPSVSLFEQFATALARRYNGNYPDPLNPGQALPAITAFQGWNEPNLYTNLTPQWVRSGSGWSAFSVGHFRRLQNAYYRAIKKVQPAATVIAGGTAPFGALDPAVDPRVAPAAFFRDLLCIRKTPGGTFTAAKKRCPKTLADGWAHHAYPVGPPLRPASNADDVVVPDMAKITGVLNAASRRGTITRKSTKSLWITEMSWDSKPDPNGLSPETHARYMAGSFYVLWRAGVTHIAWWNSRDQAKDAAWNETLQSGIFFRGDNPTLDTPKPAFTAFRFTFTAYRGGGVANLWAKPPAAGRVIVQARAGTTWKQVATLRSNGDGTVSGRLRVGKGVQLRAVQGAETSLTWKTS